jgi:iron complex outermembrane receptor protein
MLFPSTALHAQVTSSIEGTVLDTQGKGVVNSEVTARNSTTGAPKVVDTDANGHYSIGGLPAGTYTVEAIGSGFAAGSKTGIVLAEGQTQQVPLTLTISAVAEQITVNAGIDSIAAETAPSGGFIEERSAQSLISSTYIKNFTSPIADFGEIVQIVPGAFTISSDGVGLGQSKTTFRGFPDGDFDIDFDGIPFYDTNSPTHHSWAFFPAQWIGGVDFDRSPGTASTIGPTPFGGSIHLLSEPLTSEQDIRGTASYAQEVEPFRRRAPYDFRRLPDFQLQPAQRRLDSLSVPVLAQDCVDGLQWRDPAQRQHLRPESYPLPDHRLNALQPLHRHYDNQQSCLQHSTQWDSTLYRLWLQIRDGQ